MKELPDYHLHISKFKWSCQVPFLISAACACLLLGAFLWGAVIPWIKDAPAWIGWRKFRLFYLPAAVIIEYLFAVFLGVAFFYCFSDLTNFLSWVILLPVGIITIFYGSKWLLHRLKPTPLLTGFADYRESGQLDEAGRQTLADAADALETPFDPRKAEAQILRLRDVAKAIDPAFVMPAMDNARAQIAYLQSHFLSVVLKQEGGVNLKELPNTTDPEIKALWELARHKRALRRIPTQLVKDDVRDMRELYDELTGLVRSGQEFTKMTDQMNDRSGTRQEKRKVTAEEIAQKIFAQASRDSRIRGHAGKLFKEAAAELLKDVAEGRVSEEEAKREIENLRDLLNRKLDENEE